MRLKTRALSIFTLFALLLLLVFGTTVHAVESEQRAQFATPIMVVNASFLNVRTGPGVEYSVLTTVVGGTELPVLGVARDRVWYQVSTLAGVGWINSQFALPRGDFRNVPFAEAPTIVGMAAPGAVGSDDATGTVGFSSGREWGISITIDNPLRTGPSINSNSLGTLFPDMSVMFTLLEATSNEGVVWYRIRVPSMGTGWVEASKTMLRPFACGVTAVIMRTVIAPNTGPDGSGTLTGNVQVPEGAEAYLLDAINNFYKVELQDGNNGWIPSEAALIRGPVRSEYCTSGAVRDTGPGAGGGGTTGSTPGTTTGTTAQLAGPRVVINTGFLNLRSGPGAQYTVVTTLPGGTQLPVIGIAPDRVWYLVQGTFGQAWLNGEFALFRGSARGVPIIRDVAGVLSTPTATITNAVTLYATPSTGSASLGAISGPVDLPVVARTSDFNWVQVRNGNSFAWVQVSQIQLRGDTGLIPVTGG